MYCRTVTELIVLPTPSHCLYAGAIYSSVQLNSNVSSGELIDCVRLSYLTMILRSLMLSVNQMKTNRLLQLSSLDSFQT